MKCQLFDVVVLERDLPEHGVHRGDLGTVVEVYAENAFEVEFTAVSGRTAILVALSPSDVRLVTEDDRLAARRAPRRV